MHYFNFYIYFAFSFWSFSSINSYYVAVTDKKVVYRRGSANEKLTTEATVKSRDFMSVFSSWNIMSGQFKGGKVILPVLNTPPPEYHLSFRTIAMGHVGQGKKRVKVTTAKKYTKVEFKNKSIKSKNQYRKRQYKKYLTFKEFIKRLSIVFDNKP